MNLVDLLEVFRAAGTLKRVPRTGWVRAGVERPESVADHSYRVALMAALLAETLGLDVRRSMELALLHDLAESRTGDRIPGEEGLSRQEKVRQEREALAGIVGDGRMGRRLRSLLAEFEERTTPEARLVSAVDRLEMALTSIEYQGEQGIDLAEFRRSARAALEPGSLPAQLLDLLEGDSAPR